MPIYEFYCSECHTVYTFLSRSADTTRRPACPKCRRGDLERRVSSFAVARGRKEPSAEPPEGSERSGVDDARLERAMMELAQEAEGLDESDTRGTVRLLRRLYESAGLPVGGKLEEAIRRMEAGEDPEALEEALGELDDEAGMSAESETTEPRSKTRHRRLLPPRRDPELYEM